MIPEHQRTLGLVGVAVCAALLPSLAMWGFTVDDALIPLRYAIHDGHRFNPGGPSTDGVTPLPWTPLLRLVANADLVGSLERVKAISIACWTLTAGALGFAIAKEVRGRADLLVSVLSLVVLGLAFPVAAWAGSGMETGVATSLATLAVITTGPRSAALAGLAATLRPELVVWAVVASARDKRRVLSAGLAFAPFLVCAIIRLIAFGRPAPLATLAKPSDFAHGVPYVLAGAVLTLLPLLCAPIALRKAEREKQVLALAALAHFLVVAILGGDWMAYARLLIPVVPSLVLVAIASARTAHRVATALRFGIVLVLGVSFTIAIAPDGRHVHQDRKALIEAAKPALKQSKVIAALDIGWVGAAATDEATIVDLAGLTDPSIALLHGGHTSKAVDLSMLLERNVDTVLVYSDIRAVEQRIVRNPLFARRFVRGERLALGQKHYDVYRGITSSSPSP